jgi:outer membrane protein OmpA-like peptidoglycan-associated protein
MRRVIAVSLLLGLAACATVAPPQYAVFFPKGDAALTPDAQSVVVQIAEAARSNSGKLIIEGKADGGTPQDAALADERATAVIRERAGAGVQNARMEKRPAAPAAGVTGVAAHEVTVVIQRKLPW